MKARGILSIALALGAWAPVAGAQDAAQAKTDRAWLIETWEQHEKTLKYVNADHNFQTARAAMRPGKPIGREVAQKLAQLEELEGGALTAINQRMNEIMGGRYGGSNFREVATKIEGLTGGPGPVRGRGGMRATTVLEALSGIGKGVMGIEDLRKETADALLASIDKELNHQHRLRPDHDAIKTLMEYAARWNPTDRAIKARLEGWAAEVSRHRAKNDPKIDANTSPKPFPMFAGPGDPTELGRSALEFLVYYEGEADKVEPDMYGEKREFLFAVVAGDFEVSDSDITGTTQWYLPMQVAYTTARLKPDGIAVWMQFYVQTKVESGVKKGPPWLRAYAMGEHLQVRLTNLPQGAATPTPPGSGGGATGATSVATSTGESSGATSNGETSGAAAKTEQGGGMGILGWLACFALVAVVGAGAAVAAYVFVLKKPQAGAAQPPAGGASPADAPPSA